LVSAAAADLLRHLLEPLALFVEFALLRLVGFASLLFDQILRLALRIGQPLLLGLLLGLRLERLLLALLLASLDFGALLRRCASSLIQRLALLVVHWRRHQIQHADQLVHRAELAIRRFQRDDVAQLASSGGVSGL